MTLILLFGQQIIQKPYLQDSIIQISLWSILLVELYLANNNWSSGEIDK